MDATQDLEIVFARKFQLRQHVVGAEMCYGIVLRFQGRTTQLCRALWPT
jgi:hypothetical protein